MSSFGPGVYLLIVVWSITLMLCWVSLRTGHYVGELAFLISLTVTLVLVWLPRGKSQSPLRCVRRAGRLPTTPVRFETIHVKNNAEFVSKVMNSSKPVIVNFHAEWCDPCKILTPKLQELIEPLNDLDLAVVDVEENADLVHTFEVVLSLD
ncbi:Thioredoxin, mitochondrial [Eumeta japonica]|uniref:Thioredoxin, mitochondrial n=1 Tax=Eumeta variegata TaxID=151549 RepID=A0A4C1WSK4_EUMVA|nr:Thioredoxin, mitochondrial [Eumeta japonica]